MWLMCCCVLLCVADLFPMQCSQLAAHGNEKGCIREREVMADVQLLLHTMVILWQLDTFALWLNVKYDGVS